MDEAVELSSSGGEQRHVIWILADKVTNIRGVSVDRCGLLGHEVTRHDIC